MREYSILSQCYDDFTDNVSYDRWIAFTQKIWERQGINPRLVLDLGCGTGTVACKLAALGYDVVGVDRSAEMLSMAHRKCLGLDPAKRPVFICQDLSRIDLYGTVDAAVSSLDTMNHLTSAKALRAALERVCMFLNPGGSFVFDLNTEKKFSDMHGQVYIRESYRYFCVWQAKFSKEKKTCRYAFDIFRKEDGGLWRRFQETYVERCHTLSDIEGMLRDSGFASAEFWPEYGFHPIDGTEDRIFVAAKKQGL